MKPCCKCPNRFVVCRVSKGDFYEDGADLEFLRVCPTALPGVPPALAGAALGILLASFPPAVLTTVVALDNPFAIGPRMEMSQEKMACLLVLSNGVSAPGMK